MNTKYLYLMFPNVEKRRKFIINCSLTFGLRLETLADILGENKEKIYGELLYATDYMHSSLLALFELGMNVQEDGKKEFIEFFNELVEANKKKDKEKIIELLNVISDKDAMSVIKKRKNGVNRLSEEDVLIILKYQLKYLLSTAKIEKIFQVHHSSYIPRVQSLREKYPVLVSQYEALTEINYKKEEDNMNIKYLYLMFPTKEKRNIFLSQCILTFGLNLDAISMLTGFDKETLYNELINRGTKYYESVQRVFKNGMKRQDIAINDFLDFYNRLCQAYEAKDRETISIILHELSDKKAINLAKRPATIKTLTDEQILVILKYQIKYMLSVTQTADIFKLDRHGYAKRVRNLEDDYTNLVSDFNYISDFYYNSNSHKSRGV